MGRTLCLVLGDQLSLDLPSLKAIDKKNDIVLMCEVWREATYVKHHKKKIAFLFSAMRHFAKQLQADGWKIDYQVLGAEADSTFTSAVRNAIERHVFPDGPAPSGLRYCINALSLKKISTVSS